MTSTTIRTLLYLLLWSSVWFSGGCNAQPALTDIREIPPVTGADQPFAGVFGSLDGHWKGVFKIYRDSLPGDHVAPQQLSIADFHRASLQLVQTIQVDQWYRSLTPFFQRVRIRDVYSGASGSQDTVWSRGVNKVQNGAPWCAVKKPDETVLHRGKSDGPETLIWRRDERRPLKKEYFRETVRESAYAILGWGYYGQDDLRKSPPWWFYGEYRRIPEPAEKSPSRRGN